MSVLVMRIHFSCVTVSFRIKLITVIYHIQVQKVLLFMEKLLSYWFWNLCAPLPLTRACMYGPSLHLEYWDWETDLSHGNACTEMNRCRRGGSPYLHYQYGFLVKPWLWGSPRALVCWWLEDRRSHPVKLLEHVTFLSKHVPATELWWPW